MLMSKWEEWEPSDLALPDDEPMYTDPDSGQVVISFENQQLLLFRNKHWDMPTEFHGHTNLCYLTQCYRAIYYTVSWVIPLVIEQLREEDRRYKPLPSYLQQLCAAAVKMKQAWTEIGFAHTYSPQEPSRLPLSDSDRRHKADLNRVLKARRYAGNSSKPRHKYRVRLDPD
jgi:hypothetical protein